MFDKAENIPKKLRQLDKWVCWKTEKRNGKPTKVLKNPVTGKNAMSNEPKTWGSFNAALNGQQKFGFDGIGFVFGGDDGIIGIDIDDCRDPETGRLNDLAMDIVGIMDTYTEISPSGRGLHLIFRAEFNSDKKETHYEGGKHLAIYVNKYFTMTGNILDDAHADIEERTEQLHLIHKKYIDVQKNEHNKRETADFMAKNTGFLSENDVFERIDQSKNRDAIYDLLNGNWKGKYPSCSEADLALMNHLAYYADRNESLIWSIFQRSGLYREDEHRRNPKKFKTTLEKAVRECQECYSERHDRLLEQRKARRDQQNKPPEIDNGFDALVKSLDEKPAEDTTSDLGRSKIFSSRYKDRIQWCGDFKAWLIWDGKRWNEDRLMHVVQLAKELVNDMIISALQNSSKATGEEEVKRAKQIFRDTVKARSERCIKAMIELAKSDISITADDLDSDPFLLNCQNGVVDLRTGELKEHHPNYNMTKVAGASYAPGKKFERFYDFLKLITCDDPEMIDYFQQICGMAAIGKVFHEGMCIFYGSGQNGKSTFLNTISKVFGDYACTINPEMLMSQRDGRQPIGITRLDGKRFVTAIELEEGRRMSSSVLKQLSSADPITGRELYQKERTFMPTHTLIMATNFLPKIGSTDTGTWRRIAVVPFRAVIEEKTQIKDYADLLYQTDGDAILTWIVEGAIKYAKNNFHIKLPDAVKDATREYRTAEDWVGNFLYECCKIGNYEERGGLLYEVYSMWCEKNNEYKRRPRDFAAALELAGYSKRKTMHGVLWSGLRLLKPDEKYSNKYEAVKTPIYTDNELDEDGLDEYTRSRM